MIGKTVLHYEILEELGRGGMGVIYKAQDLKLDRLVALKFLPSQLTSGDTERARLLQEAKAASAINHPHVCVIHDVKEHDGQPFIVMEFVEGVNLRQRIKSDPLPVPEALSYALQIGEAIEEAHRLGIIHRDLKPENVMVDRKNRLKVMDFGLAKLKHSLSVTRMTQTGGTVGTLAYMAPEQLQGGESDERTDIFAFGAMLYELLAGRLPFRGDYEAAMMYAIVSETPEPLELLRPEVPPELAHVVARALAKEPAKRYQTIQPLLEDLRQQQEWLQQNGQSANIKTVVSGPQLLPRKTAPRRKFLWAGIAIIAVLAFVLFSIFSPFTPDTERPFQQMRMTSLTGDGKAQIAAISPDGKYVVHAKNDGGRQSLWVRQVATASHVEIVPPAESNYVGLTFSRDGNYVYYVRNDSEDPQGALYRVPVLGGMQSKMVTNIASAISLAPDANQFVFLRYDRVAGGGALMLASLEGGTERELAVRKGNTWFWSGPAWSPDGKTLACGVGFSGTEDYYTVFAISDDGTSQRQLTPHHWASGGNVAWLKDGSGLVLSAAERGSSSHQIWHVSYPAGEVRRITNDLNSYSDVSITVDGQALAVIKRDEQANLWLAPGNAVDAAQQLSTGRDEGFRGLAWTLEGEIIYTSSAGGNVDLWRMAADGSGARQLSFDAAMDYSPAVSPDGKFVVFVSERSGMPNLWRMRLDGSETTPLTERGGLMPRCSPAGHWVVFSYWLSDRLVSYKVPLQGGEPQQITDRSLTQPAFSPDGNRLAFFYLADDNAPWRILIMSFESEAILHTFELPASVEKESGLYWSADGQSLYYLNAPGGIANLWSQPLDGAPPKQLTSLKAGGIFRLAISHDGAHAVMARGRIANDVVLVTQFK